MAAAVPNTGMRNAVRAKKGFNNPCTGTLQNRPSAENLSRPRISILLILPVYSKLP